MLQFMPAKLPKCTESLECSQSQLTSSCWWLGSFRCRAAHQSQGNSLRPFDFRARGAVVATPPTFEERDTHATCVILACRFALFKVLDFAWRLVPVYFAGARVTFNIGTNIHPDTFYLCQQVGICLNTFKIIESVESVIIKTRITVWA